MSVKSKLWWGLGCWLALLVVAFPVRAGQQEDTALTDPGDVPRLRLAESSQELPLEHTEVTATVTGFVAEVEVKQTYRNTHAEPIEAVYVFPLPENSAVSDMEIVIGTRTIKAEIKKRADARETYEAARARGNTAALLEQERANIFTQSVANIAPGEDIDVVIRYVQNMTYDAGEYEFVFPMVVGPRYAAHTPDAERIRPPVIGKGTRTGHDISVQVHLDAGVPIRKISVPNHRTSTQKGKSDDVTVTLAEAKSIPNRDFVLRYRVDGPDVQSTLFVAEGKGERFFTLLLQPPTSDVDALVGDRELIFVVDVSGSMSGVPLAMCKIAMKQAIGKLRPVDTFNVLVFSGGTGQAFERPRPANRHNISEALKFVSGLRAGGGTEILNAVDAALSPPVGAGRHRYVFFLTDGFVGIENAVYGKTRRWVSRLAKNGQRARVFAMGTGSSPNRELLSKLTKAGNGVAVYGSNREAPGRAVSQFYRYIDHAVMTDVRVDWQGAKAADTHPEELPDLYVSRPAITHGRLEGKLPHDLQLVGRVGETDVEVPVRVEVLERGPGAVQSQLWARARIEDLEHRMIWEGDDSYVDEITKLGLGHRLVTRYTSFVAVDRTRVVGDGDPKRIDQPTDAPEGVDLEMAGANQALDTTNALDLAGAINADASVMRISARQRGCARCSVTSSPPPGVALLLLVVAFLRRRKNSSASTP